MMRGTSRKGIGRAMRRERQVRTNQARQRWARIASVLAKGERWWRYAHEQDLSSAEREAIGQALAELLRDQWSGEVTHSGYELETMYHAGFYLACSWLVFSGTEAYELREVFNRHRILLHHDWWLTDGWDAWHDKYGVKCQECGTFTYAGADSVDADPAEVAWPRQCCGCAAGLPPRHDTSVFGSGSSWWVDCSCGWRAENPVTAERHAKTLATRHRNHANQSAARDALSVAQQERSA